NKNKIIFKLLPVSLHKYIILLRLDRPIGFMLLFYPLAFSMAYSTTFNLFFLYYIFIFFIGSVTMRSAGCVINDLIDRKIDIKVSRTKDRPIASGSIKLKESFIILFLLLLLGLLILFSLNKNSIILGFIIFPLVILYPLAKKYFFMPQLILGLIYNWGVFIGWSTMGLKIEFNEVVILYFSCVSWTLIYDTVYATQDIEDDKYLDLNSSAILFGSYKKPILAFLIFIQFFLLNLLGSYLNLGVYYSLLISIVGIIIVLDLLFMWDFSKTKSLDFFKRNNLYGLIILIIILISKNFLHV
ncbi:MAG: 4-hydroxybenzoate octaprenyltransferase, partial [Pelagibacteraceae bacterium]|nr:4-hydroxybenzoate octaprenyltransferase [Pelagibacteraceae bacterium]